jgi:osmotically-inducible protein OsmY/sporulation protein YlmC with PRC-barrel domain
MELKIGTRVETADGPVGHVHQVILNPSQRRVVGLVVRAGLVPPRDLALPVDLIADATDERVILRIPRAQLFKQPEFNPSRFSAVSAEKQGYQGGEALIAVEDAARAPQESAQEVQPENTQDRALIAGYEVALQKGQPVWATDGRAGRVDLLFLDSKGQVQHFAVRKGRFLSHDVYVPVEMINRIDARGVWLTIDRAVLERLPSYQPDPVIAEEVDQALWRDEVLRIIDYEAIDFDVQDGVVTLRGYASTSTNKKRAERVVRKVPGVLDVENRLITDEEVAIAVSKALGRDERTRHQNILVSARHGVVTLNGEMESAEDWAAAEEVAASISQVRGVVNYIRAPGVEVAVPPQVWQPRVGQDVYAEDMFLGHVDRVIVNPHNRLVSAIVVRGSFPDQERWQPGMLPYEVPRSERQVVIPIESVRYVTISGVLLSINAVDAARYPDFDLNGFVVPHVEWQPPYPYTHDDVLLVPDENLTEAVGAIQMQNNVRRNT